MPPPDNSSRTTRQELEWLKNYNDGKVDEEVVKRGDKPKKNQILRQQLSFLKTKGILGIVEYSYLKQKQY